MQKHFEAVYENGVFKPLIPLEIPEHQAVHLIVEEEDECALSMAALAMAGGGFEFLENPQEDVYSPTDGRPLS